MSKQNYYLSLHQSILAKNLTKIVELTEVVEQEQENYQEEYLDLNYAEIFKDNDPMDFLESLLEGEEYKEIYNALDELQEVHEEIEEVIEYIEAHNPLATEKNIAIRDKNHLELMNHPLINYCPNPKDELLIIETLLSSSYSKKFSKEELASKLDTAINKSTILSELLSVIATSITIDSNNSLSIVLIGDNIKAYDPTQEIGTEGYHDPIKNILVAVNKKKEIDISCIIHELAHKTMNLLFKNYVSPYPYDSELLKYKYHQAIKETLLNIQQFIKNDFGLSLEFEDQDSTFQMGKTLKTILFPQLLSGEDIEYCLSLFKKHNLNINDKFSWLKDNSLMARALLDHNFELADALVDNGAIIPNLTMHIAKTNNVNLLNWALKHNQILNVTSHDCEGRLALDYAKDPQIIKVLISAGAVAHSPNYEFINRCPKSKKDSTVINKQLDALKSLLSPYSVYTEDEEDAEFVVIFPEIIAEGLYNGKTVEIIQPMAEYWQEVISPAAVSYQDQFLSSGIYLTPLDYPDFI